jgi:hypothetical protein
MRRKHFLLGLLCGCLLGVGATMVAWHAGGNAAAPAARPLLMTVPARPAYDARPPGIPPDAQRREFNGEPYYIIPLAKSGR